MYYQGCAVFVEVADAFANSPLPDSAAIVKEYVEYEGAVKEDAIEMAHEDLEAYREELNNRSNGAKELAVPQCATGIKASAHYGIDNQWTAKLFETLKMLDENNETLNTKIEKFDPSTLFADPAYFKTKARLEQISKSEVMTPEEQINTYRDIIKDAFSGSGCCSCSCQEGFCKEEGQEKVAVKTILRGSRILGPRLLSL